jgi:eukaryotic-like serine/threonine-protein kinase
VVPVLNEELGEAADAAPLDSRWMQDVQRLLTPHVGPMAALLKRRAAAGATSRQQFIARLADLAADGRERETLIAALRRLT